MNKEHLEDILVDLEVLYGKLPPLARAHINEAQQCLMHIVYQELTPRYAGHLLNQASSYVGLARSQLA